MVPVVCLSAGALAVFLLAVKATSKYCDDGHICSPPRECCASGCCHAYGPPGGIPPPQVPAPPPPLQPSMPTPPSIATVGDRQHILTVISWNHWYFWFLLLFLLVSCLLGGCGWLRRRRLSECRCCCCCCCCFGCPPTCRMDSRASDTEDDDEDDDEEGEGGWGSEGTPSRTYGPRCVPYHSPPPYSEVTSKPDLYPLVISVGGGNGCGAKSPVSMAGSNNGAGGYLMVHFFRNYFVRPVGSLSATSTVDSLSSSFLCSAANEANTLIPPPYPCEEEDEEVADERTEADEEVEEDEDGDQGRADEDVTDDDNRMASRSLSARRSRFRRNLTDEQATDVSDSQAPPSPSGASWSQAEDLRLAFSGSEVSSLGLGTPCSPPRATTPTPGLSNTTTQPSEELRDLLDKIQRLPGAGGSSGSGREGGVHGKRRTSTGGRREGMGRMAGQRRGSGWLLLGPSGGKVVGGAGTRSAPTTPSTHFAPGLFRPASATRGPATDGGSPLLSRNDSTSTTHEEEEEEGGAVEEEEEDAASPSS